MIDRPHPLTVERDRDGSYVAADDATLVYGCGDTPDEALADYDASLADWRALTLTEALSAADGRLAGVTEMDVFAAIGEG